MRSGKVWRFITPLFLHANFAHIFSNAISQFILGIALESALGTIPVVIVYIAGGIGGNLFSSLIDQNIAVGASTGIFALIAMLLAFTILN